MSFCIEFEHRGDSGAMLVGPFPSRGEANHWIDERFESKKPPFGGSSAWTISPLAHPDSLEARGS